jgi:hypothetical protein
MRLLVEIPDEFVFISSEGKAVVFDKANPRCTIKVLEVVDGEKFKALVDGYEIVGVMYKGAPLEGSGKGQEVLLKDLSDDQLITLVDWVGEDKHFDELVKEINNLSRKFEIWPKEDAEDYYKGMLFWFSFLGYCYEDFVTKLNHNGYVAIDRRIMSKVEKSYLRSLVW